MTPLQILLAASPQLAALHAAVGAALTQPQQLHVSAHWPELAAWLGTETGKVAMQTFIQDWMTDHA